jgi:hypothetical protein
LCHKFGIAEVHRFHRLYRRHVNKSVWKQAQEVTKKRDQGWSHCRNQKMEILGCD